MKKLLVILLLLLAAKTSNARGQIWVGCPHGFRVTVFVNDDGYIYDGYTEHRVPCPPNMTFTRIMLVADPGQTPNGAGTTPSWGTVLNDMCTEANRLPANSQELIDAYNQFKEDIAAGNVSSAYVVESDLLPELRATLQPATH